jgi:hypothetical protein
VKPNEFTYNIATAPAIPKMLDHLWQTGLLNLKAKQTIIKMY